MADELESETGRGLDFYVSYASRDRIWAEWVGGQLESAGYTSVLALQLLPGDNIVLAREDALARADRVLALCSDAYFSGGFTEQDWTAVLAAQSTRLIPVWIEDLEGKQFPRLLRSLQPIKLFGLHPAVASRRLLDGLAGKLGPEAEPVFPGPAVSAEPGQDAAPASPMPGVSRPGILHVPPHNPAFTGRDAMLVHIRETLLRSPGMVVLQGPGGMGKTQLSIEYAHRFASGYEIVWVIDSEQPELIVGQLAELANALGTGIKGSDTQLAAAAALAALRDRKGWLLIFDNVEDPDHVTEFLPHGPGHVLVTTRAGNWQEIAQPITVEEFSRHESTALLMTRVPALTAADASRVAEALGDLPLALAQAAGTLETGLPAAEFQRLLAEHATQVLSEGKSRFYPETLAAATLIALDKLAASDPKAASLLCLCSYLAPESIPATWFRDTTGVWEASQAFGHIRDIGLGRVDQQGLRLHRLTQAIVRDHTAGDQAAYRDAVIALLASAAPRDSDDPAHWPDWASLAPHLLIVDPHDAPDAFRPVACAAARYLLVSGQAKAALTMTQRLHEAWAAELGPDNTDTLTNAQNLVHAFHDNADFAKALELQEDILTRRRRTLGDDHPDTLRSASDLAVTFSSLGRRKEALPLEQDTYDRRRRVLGEDHPDTLTSAGNLASALHELGRSKDALALIQDTYERCRRVLGEDHPDTLRSASGLANTLRKLRRRNEALALDQDTYDRRRRVLGEDHPATLTSAGNLAGTLYELQRRKDALALLQDSYDRHCRVLGEDHPYTLTAATNLAVTLGALGRKDALALLQDSYDRHCRVLGEDHPDTLKSAGHLAGTLYDLGRRKEALVLHQDVYDRRRRVLGEDHPDTLAAAANLAANLQGVGQRSAALRVKGKKPGKRKKR